MCESHFCKFFEIFMKYFFCEKLRIKGVIAFKCEMREPEDE